VQLCRAGQAVTGVPGVDHQEVTDTGLAYCLSRLDRTSGATHL